MLCRRIANAKCWNVHVVVLKESIESANTTIEDEDVKGRESCVSCWLSLPFCHWAVITISPVTPTVSLLRVQSVLLLLWSFCSLFYYSPTFPCVFSWQLSKVYADIFGFLMYFRTLTVFVIITDRVIDGTVCCSLSYALLNSSTPITPIHAL